MCINLFCLKKIDPMQYCCLKNAFPADDNLLPFQASSCAPMTLEHGAPIAVAKMSSHLAPILNM